MKYRAYKTQIQLTNQQQRIVNQSIGICRFLYNKYLEINKKRYENGEPHLSAFSFNKLVTHELSDKFPWIKNCHSDARENASNNAYEAYKKFWNPKLSNGFPRFKSKNKNESGVYYRRIRPIEKNRIKLTKLGWVKIKEKNYIPEGIHINSATITRRGGKYYISCLFPADVLPETPADIRPFSDGQGIDLGLKEFAYSSTGDSFRNINKDREVKRLEKKLKRESRALSRKLEARKVNKTETRSNLNKNILRVQKLHARLASIRENYHHEVVSSVTKEKPRFITVENLNIKGMMKNRHLSRAISKQGFYGFKKRLQQKCIKVGISLREVDRFYPSSKLCSRCGEKKVDLKLTNRTFVCPSCGWEMDRDLNAAMNLKYAKEFIFLSGGE